MTTSSPSSGANVSRGHERCEDVFGHASGRSPMPLHDHEMPDGWTRTSSEHTTVESRRKVGDFWIIVSVVGREGIWGMKIVHDAPTAAVAKGIGEAERLALLGAFTSLTTAAWEAKEASEPET